MPVFDSQWESQVKYRVAIKQKMKENAKQTEKLYNLSEMYQVHQKSLLKIGSDTIT